jgi:hypothetical protein
MAMYSGCARAWLEMLEHVPANSITEAKEDVARKALKAIDVSAFDTTRIHDHVN